MSKASSKSSIGEEIENYEYRERKDADTIPFRIDVIKKLLENKQLRPIVDYDITDTENFLKGKEDEENDFDDSFSSHDTRASLNKKKHDFNEIIDNIGGRLKYVKSGTTGHTFKGIVDSQNEERNYAVKVVAYPKKEKYGGIYDARRPENAELMMIRLLSYFVVKKQTPHIVLPIATFNTSIKPFTELIKEEVVDEENKKYAEFIERYEAGEYYDEVSILLSEWANRGDFLDFIKKHYKNFQLMHWKAFFFQLISTLAVIQSKFPYFRHNDLKGNNLLVNKIYKKMNKFTYKVNGNIYSIPNIGYQLKLWDFDFACIPGVVDNRKVLMQNEWTRSINVGPEKNRYYDIHYFFNTLIRKGFFPQILEPSITPIEVIEFIDRILPKKYRSGKYVSKRARILINDEYITPDEILKSDPFFEEYRRTEDDIKKEKKDRKERKTRKDKKTEDKKTSERRKSKKGYDFELINLDDLLK